MYVCRTFLKGWVTEEEIVAASSRSCLAPVGLENFVECVSDLLNLIVEGHHTLLEELVSWHVLADVEVSSLQIARRMGTLWREGEMKSVLWCS